MKTQTHYKTLVFNVSGGIGKHIAFSAVAAAARKAYPDSKIIVIAAWPDPLLHNPNIDRLYRSGNIPYFYQDHIAGQDAKLCFQEPYMCEDYIYKRKHLIEVWCDLCEIPYNGEKPQVFLTPSEIDLTAYRINRNKPLMVIQTNGGAEGQQNAMSWARDLPLNLVQPVVERFKHEYHIFHLRRNDQPSLPDTEQLSLPLRDNIAAISLANRRLLIDSFAQHAAAATESKSTVCWIANKPEVLGYPIHTNIVAAGDIGFRHMADSVHEMYNITGVAHENPFTDFNYFNPQDLINSLT